MLQQNANIGIKSTSFVKDITRLKREGKIAGEKFLILTELGTKRRTSIIRVEIPWGGCIVPFKGRKTQAVCIRTTEPS